MKRASAFALSAALAASPAYAQSVSPFHITGTQLLSNVGVGGTSVSLQAGATSVVVDNQGANNIICSLTAQGAGPLIGPTGKWQFGVLGEGTLYCEASSGTSNILLIYGVGGLAAGVTGVGSGGGGGGNVTIVSPLGTQAIIASVAVNPATASVWTVSPNPPVNVTATNCSGSVTTGGTAQNAITATATLHGFTITNIDTINSSEPLWISLTGAAVAGAIGSTALPGPTATTYAGQGSYTTPYGFGFNGNLSVLGGTSTHKWTCFYW